MTNLALMVALSEQMGKEGITGDPGELQRRYNLALAGQWNLGELNLEERSNPMPKRKIQPEAEIAQPPDPTPDPHPPSPGPQPDAPLTIPVDQVDPNPEQPRVDFNREELQELADNITANGVIQPITVERAGDRYILHDGERRLRASKLAGLAEIPAYIVQPVPAADRRVRAVVANLQRDDLNAIELAQSLQEMKDRDGLTDEEIAVKISKNRQWVTNKRSLLRLPDVLRSAIAAGTVDERHGHRFMPLTKIRPDEMDGANLVQDPNFTSWGPAPTPNALAMRIARGGMTSDEVEKYVKRVQDSVEQSNRRKAEAKARTERQAELAAKIKDLPCLNCGKMNFKIGSSDEIICNHCGRQWATLAAYERHAAAKVEREEQDRARIAEFDASLAGIEEWLANPPARLAAAGPTENIWTIRTRLSNLANSYQGLNLALTGREVIGRYDAAKRALLKLLEEAEQAANAAAKDAARDSVRAQTIGAEAPAINPPAVELPANEQPAAESPAVEPTAAEPPVTELSSTQPSSLPVSGPQPPTPKTPAAPPAITLPTKAETQITIRFPASENGHRTFVAMLSKPGQLLPKTYRGQIDQVAAVIQQAVAEALAQASDKVLAESRTQKPLGGANGNGTGSDDDDLDDDGLIGDDLADDPELDEPELDAEPELAGDFED